ncbi:MAG: 2TM domain-containing protein [Actinomycetes bacterium]
MSIPDPTQAPVDPVRKAAIAALQDKSNFWRSLGGWVILSLFFVAIWFFAGRGYFWPAWAIIGIGIGVFFMGLRAFGPNQGPPSESKIQEQMRKMQ